MAPPNLFQIGTGRPRMGQMMAERVQNETETRMLAALEAASARPSLARSVPTATFVSQLIAARERMTPQRPRRNGTPEGAVGAYGQTARLADRRMPAGYRRTVVA
jgi:hypothetical protein